MSSPAPQWPSTLSPLLATKVAFSLVSTDADTSWLFQQGRPRKLCSVHCRDAEDTRASTALCPSSKTGPRHFQFSFNTLITPSTNLQDLTNKQLSFSSLKTLITTYLRWRREKSCLGSQAVWALGNAYRYFWANVFVCLLQQQFLLGNMTLKDPKFIQLTWTTWGKATPYATLRMVSQVTTLRFP